MENLLCSVTQCDALCGSFLWLALTASQGYLCNTFRRRLGAKQSICQGRVSRTTETLQILASEGVVNTRMFQCKNLYMIEMTETWLKYTEVWLDPRRGCNNCQCRAVSQLRCSLGSDLSVESSNRRSLTLKFEWFECCTPPGVDPQPCCRCFSAKDTAAWISSQMERRFFLEKRNWTRDLSMILIETGRNPNRSKTGLACEKKQS